MTFRQSIFTVYRQYATFSGRAPRSEFWWFMLFAVFVSFVLDLVSTPLATLWDLGNLVPMLAVGARRLHDSNRSGWWQLLPVAGLLMAGIVPVALGVLDSAAVASAWIWIDLAVLLGTLVPLIVWFASRGTKGPNRFGDDPLGQVDAEVFA